jgi:periplasmic copper chaperone A
VRTYARMLLAAPLLMALQTEAFAHAHLRTASPPPDGTTSSRPTEVSITFSEGVEPKFSTIHVTDAAGNRFDEGSPRVAGDNKQLMVALKPLSPGAYTVTWHATSVDTHQTDGTYRFTVAADAAAIRIDNVWARPSVGPSGTSATYLTITDTGAPDRLTGVSTPAAGSAEIHQTTNENGVMKMRSVPSISLETDKTVRFAPGGYHIMLMELKQPLKSGDSFPLTFQFEHAAPITVSVPVQSGSGTAAMQGHDMRMDGGAQAPMHGTGQSH